MLKRIALTTLAAATFATATLASAAFMPAAAQGFGIYFGTPAPRYYAPPPPPPVQQVWVPAHWRWHHGRQVWIDGHWEPRGPAWNSGWNNGNRGWGWGHD